MKLFKLTSYFVLMLSLTFLIQGCSEDDASETSLNFATFEAKVKNVAVNPNETLVAPIKVYTTQISGADRTFNVEVASTSTMDPAYRTVPATVTVPANSNEGILNISLQGVGLSLSTPKTVVLKLVSTDGTYTGDSTTVNVRENCPHNAVSLSITFDNYPEETAWELYNSNNEVVASGGFNEAGTAITGYAALGFADRSTFSTIFCLEDGTYTFVIYDDYGDGMYTSSTVSGSYSLSHNGVVLASGGGNFGQFQDTTFTLN